MANQRMGALRERMEFQERQSADDGWGNPVPGAGSWVTQFTADAAFRPLRGSEQVMADRLNGVQPYIVTIRSHAASKKITAGWRLKDVRSSRVFAVASPIADPDGKNQWLEFLIREGTHDGD